MRAAPCLRRSLAVLILSLICVFTLSGCSDSATAENPDIPVGAGETLDAALTTMFTWRPAFEAGPAPAFERARKYLTPYATGQLRAVEGQVPPDWAAWAEAGALVTPTFTVEKLTGTNDAFEQHSRSVTVTQRVKDVKGRVLAQYTFTLYPVVVSFANGEWHVSEITGVEKAGGGLCPRNPDGTCS